MDNKTLENKVEYCLREKLKVFLDKVSRVRGLVRGFGNIHKKQYLIFANSNF